MKGRPSNPMSGAIKDQRGTYRLRNRLKVTRTSENNFYTGFTENISDGGVFMATYDCLELGTRFMFQLTLPDGGPPIIAQGEVRWLREYNRANESITPGMGVSFLKLDPRDAARIQHFIENQRDSIFIPD